MTTFVLRRLVSATALLIVLTAVVFTLQQLSPADGVKAYLGTGASPAAVAAARHQLGYDRPLIVQYLHYLGGIAHGDLGLSLRTRDPVTTDLASAAPATLELVFTAFILAIVVALLYVVSSAVLGGSVFRTLLLVAACAPPFLLGIAGLITFYAHLRWLPGGGRGTVGGPTGFTLVNAILHGDPAQFASGVSHLVLPALTLAIAPALAIGRVLHNSVDTTIRADYIRTANATGISPWRVYTGHVARNSIGPALSMAGLQLGFMCAGVVVVEQVFNWPGVGNYLAESIPVADFSAIAGVTLLLATVYIVANAAVDILQALADPRIAL
ncbi:ABC transporter permease [Gordonia polyisoprenivorans]|uniref:ABC transporter permease n=1 Tax=Gordonia polyisoprenivorans TaxID=84595 RepID=UPI001AD7A8C7|nr:ABC transporter permease [Gordonia polyisoprenivorans]QTI70531.1 ABC transporter permease [Gordonia polyisoprenivorans]